MNSSSCECQWRIEDSLPGANVVWLMPMVVSPSALPSWRFSRGKQRER